MKRRINNMYSNMPAVFFNMIAVRCCYRLDGLDVKNIFLKYFLLSSSLFNGVGCNVIL